MGHSRQFFSNTKKQVERALNQSQAINDCLLCRERQKIIEAHHDGKKGLLKTTLEINKCKECRETLLAIIACARMGHVYPEE